MILSERHMQNGRACFEGEQVTPTPGEHYANDAPLAPCNLPCCSGPNSFSPAYRFSDSNPTSVRHKFIRHKWHETASQSELHEQGHICEQQRRDSSSARELFRAATGSHCTVSRRELQLQSKPTRHVLPSRWCCQVAMRRAAMERHRDV